MRTQLISNQKGEKITSKSPQGFFYTLGNTKEFEHEFQIGNPAIDYRDADYDFQNLDAKSREWFLKNLYINDQIAWQQDYKNRNYSGEVSW